MDLKIDEMFSGDVSFLKVSIVAAMLSLLAFVFYAGSSEPEPFDQAASSVDGVLKYYRKNKSTGGMVGVESNGRLFKFVVHFGYVHVNSDLAKAVGRAIEIRSYGDVVASCSVEGVAVCVPLCASAYSCRLKFFEQGRLLYFTLFVFGVLVSVVFMSAYFLRKMGDRSGRRYSNK